MTQAAFSLVRGIVSLPASASPSGSVRVLVMSTHDRVLPHDGIDVGDDGHFAIAFPTNPREAWLLRGIQEVSFLVRIGESSPPRPAHPHAGVGAVFSGTHNRMGLGSPGPPQPALPTNGACPSHPLPSRTRAMVLVAANLLL